MVFSYHMASRKRLGANPPSCVTHVILNLVILETLSDSNYWCGYTQGGFVPTLQTLLVFPYLCRVNNVPMVRWVNTHILT